MAKKATKKAAKKAVKKVAKKPVKKAAKKKATATTSGYPPYALSVVDPGGATTQIFGPHTFTMGIGGVTARGVLKHNPTTSSEGPDLTLEFVVEP